MDFLRLISDDLHALRSETRKKFPAVREAVDKAAEAMPLLQKQYAAALRLEGAAPGPGHALFKSESMLRPFLLACNHTNASHKIIILALVSIQRLVSWDAIEQSSVSSILRVLQMQAEKNTHSDVQVKLLQTLLQLVTLAYEEKDALPPVAAASTTNGTASTAATAGSGPLSGLTLHPNGSQQSISIAAPSPPPEAENALVGNEDLVMQAIWICIHLHGASSGANSVVGNTAAMTIRQVVSLAFGKVPKSVEAKRVGVLVFQELCFLSREESGVWLKRTATSPMSAALSVELLETVLSSHRGLFRDDTEFHAVLKQHVCSLLQTALELGCGDKAMTWSLGGGGSSSSSSSGGLSINSNANSSSSSGAGPFFPLLVRVMRLASVVLCSFSDVLADECAVVVRGLLEIVATGAFYQTSSAKSPSHAKITAQDVKSFLSHSSSSSHTHHSSSNNGPSSISSSNSGANGSSGGSGSCVTWPVLLALEVLNRVCQEAAMVAALAQFADPVVAPIARTLSSVITTSPAADFRALSGATDALAAPRCGLELLNEQDSPPLQPFFSAIRVALTSQSNLVASVFELSRTTEDATASAVLCVQCVAPVAPYAVHAANAMMRHCREVELITMSLKAYHVLATTASRLRANVERGIATSSSSGDSNVAQLYDDAASRMDDVVISCLRALCAFSFPLPDGLRSSARALSISNDASASSALDDASSSVSDDGESCVVVITWREVHAMKALFGAAHIMEEELTELEWCALLEGFEIVVGLTDPRLKTGQQKLPTRHARISAFRVEDEDVEQQLVMLGHSIVEFFRDALKLSSVALRRLLAAVRKVCWDQLGLPLPVEDASHDNASRAGSAAALQRTGGVTAGLSSHNNVRGADDAPTLAASHHMRLYQNFLGVGLTGTGAFTPCFALRMLTQLAASSKRCFEEVTKQLVLLSTCVPAPNAAPVPQLHQLQTFTIDCVLQLMQDALLHAVNSLSPTSKVPSEGNVAALAAYTRANPPLPHDFDQHELFAPLRALVRCELKDRALVGVLGLLNACGHLVHAGWPLVLGALQEAGELGDARTQVLAFKCVRVVVDDLLAAIPRAYLPHCVACIGRFASCAKDVNISLTAVNELWSVADVIGKHSARPCAPSSVDAAETESARDHTHWSCAFRELAAVALDTRSEVRNSALNTLFGTAVTYGAHFLLADWRVFIDDTVLPLAAQLTVAGRADSTALDGVDTGSSASDTKPSHSAPTSTTSYMMHHSRDSAAKQWDESRVLLLTGVSRVLQTNWSHLCIHSAWIADVWRALLVHVARSAARGMAKEVALAAVQTLLTLLQVSSAADFEQIAHAQPVRVGAGMRVVGGALVAAAAPASGSSASAGKRTHAASSPPSSSSPIVRDPMLWNAAFDQLLRLCDDRYNAEFATATSTVAVAPFPATATSESESVAVATSPPFVWLEDDEQEIASAVVAVLVTLYTQATAYEFATVANVVRLLETLDTLLQRHVLRAGVASKTLATITASSLQSRVLNAFEDCGSFATHPQVHAQALDQLTAYVTAAAARELVFVTRHALTALAKLFASVSPVARRDRFLDVLFCVQPFLLGNGSGNSNSTGDSSGIDELLVPSAVPPAAIATNERSPAPSPNKPPTAAQKAASQLWTHALRVLLVLVAHGLAAVQLAQTCWQPLLATINLFLQPGSGAFPVYVRTEEDAALVLSVLECVVDSAIAVLARTDARTLDASSNAHTGAFAAELLALLAAGVDASHPNRAVLRCCVRQLVTLSLQQSDAAFAHLAQLKLVACASAALHAFAALEAAATADPTAIAAARERVVVLLASACEVALGPRRVLELFPAICACIPSADLEVRQLLQRLLLQARVAEVCLDALDQVAGDEDRSEAIGDVQTSSYQQLQHGYL